MDEKDEIILRMKAAHDKRIAKLEEERDDYWEEIGRLEDLIKALVQVRHNGVGGHDYPAFIDPDGWLKEYANEVLEIAKRSEKGDE